MDASASQYDALAALRTILDTEGLEGALGWLNSRTDYRYTSIYKLTGDRMRKVAIFDRQRQGVEALEEVPLNDSFCQYVMRDGVFSTGNSGDDPRLSDHAYRGILNSYFGLPLSTAPGSLFGTLCHFDIAPHDIADQEADFLYECAPVIMAHISKTIGHGGSGSNT